MEEKKKNSKKIIVFILLVIFGIALVIVSYKNSNNLVVKGYVTYGFEYCEGHEIVFDCIFAPTDYYCGICKKEINLYGEVICSDCAEVTNRCNICGKLLSD